MVAVLHIPWKIPQLKKKLNFNIEQYNICVNVDKMSK